MSQEYWNCPFCNEEIAVDAKSCPFCGSDEETGWSEECYMDGVLPAESDYDASVEEEFGKEKAPHESRGAYIIIALVVIAFIVSAIVSL